MKNNKIFIACDSTNISRIKEIINKTKYQYSLLLALPSNTKNFLKQVPIASPKLNDLGAGP